MWYNIFRQNAILLITRIICIQDSFTCSHFMLHLLNYLFRLVCWLYILTSSSCAASLCIPISSWLARHTLLYLITICWNEDFNQGLGWVAPKRWSKYTTAATLIFRYRSPKRDSGDLRHSLNLNLRYCLRPFGHHSRFFYTVVMIKFL